jgi:hypothetical protein
MGKFLETVGYLPCMETKISEIRKGFAITSEGANLNWRWSNLGYGYFRFHCPLAAEQARLANNEPEPERAPKGRP